MLQVDDVVMPKPRVQITSSSYCHRDLLRHVRWDRFIDHVKSILIDAGLPHSNRQQMHLGPRIPSQDKRDVCSFRCGRVSRRRSDSVSH
ncbi:hypothetical protein ACH79_38430 [Bradyrhizobium sp. CCBAU 051011]|nr:hypothetical protein ACH79_38430 [Bradyrhizobium sp. CCBAU 051011]